MPQATARANAKKSSVRARVEHVFAHQKNRFGLFIRTIGLARAEAKLTLANLAYNMDRLIFHERRGGDGMTPSRSPEPPAKPPGHHAEAAGKAAAPGTATPSQPDAPRKPGVDAGVQLTAPASNSRSPYSGTALAATGKYNSVSNGASSTYDFNTPQTFLGCFPTRSSTHQANLISTSMPISNRTLAGIRYSRQWRYGDC